jgi:flagellin-specific chaperone FliS
MPRQFVNITHAEMMDDISKLTSGEKVIVNLLDGYTQSGREQE